MPRPVRSVRTPKAQFRQGGTPSVFTCPDCQGTLFLLRDNGLIRYRCRIGHVYSPESMMESQDENVERLMWSASRALEEQAEYITGLAGEVGKRDHKTAQAYHARSRAAKHAAEIIRKLVTRGTEDQKIA